MTELGSLPNVVNQIPWTEVVRKKNSKEVNQVKQISGYFHTQNRFQPLSQGNF